MFFRWTRLGSRILLAKNHNRAQNMDATRAVAGAMTLTNVLDAALAAQHLLPCDDPPPDSR